MFILFIFYLLHEARSNEIASPDMQFLNELPLKKLITLKASLQELLTSTEYDNVSTTTPSYIEQFGAQAMAIKGLPIKRGDYGEAVYKKGEYSKISNIFTMSVTTLAFLAFGGYLLCLIVQAVKQKEMYNTGTTVQQPTFFINAGIKKRPQIQLASSYGRKKRATRLERSLREIDLPPEELFSTLLQLCEGYAKWNERYGGFDMI